MNNTFLTSHQVAEMLQVHPLTVLKYIKEGKIKGVKLGRVWRVKKEDVFAFIEQQASGGAKNVEKETVQKEEVEDKREEINEVEEEIPIEEQLSSSDESPAEDVESKGTDHYII